MLLRVRRCGWMLLRHRIPSGAEELREVDLLEEHVAPLRAEDEDALLNAVIYILKRKSAVCPEKINRGGETMMKMRRAVLRFIKAVDLSDLGLFC